MRATLSSVSYASSSSATPVHSSFSFSSSSSSVLLLLHCRCGRRRLLLFTVAVGGRLVVTVRDDVAEGTVATGVAKLPVGNNKIPKFYF